MNELERNNHISFELELMLLFKAKILKFSMDKFQPITTRYDVETESKVTNFFNKMKNYRNDNINRNNSYKLNDYKTIYDNFRNELAKNGITDLSDKRIKTLCDYLFEDDVTYKKRISFVMNYVLNMNDVRYEKSVFNELNEEFSIYLGLPQNARISDISNSFKKHWKSITSNSTFNTKLALTAFGVSLGVLLLAGPFGIGAIAGASHATLTAVGGSVVGGMSVANAVAIAGSAAIGLIVYGTAKAVDRTRLLKEFQELTTDEMSYSLALNITILEYIKKLYGNNCNEFKETISFLMDSNYNLQNAYFLHLKTQNDYKDKLNLLLKSFKIITNEI